MTLLTHLATLTDRCTNGYAQVHHPYWCNCQQVAPVAPTDEWQLFLAALRAAVREDGTIHQGDVRPAIRGRIEPKHIGTLYRRARLNGLIREVGFEQSTDVEGRNADKLSRCYAWVGEAA